VWALVPALNAGANFVLDTEGVVWEQSDALVVLNYVAVSLAMVITLLGTGRIAERLESLRATTSSDHFREMNSTTTPLLAAAATSLAFAVAALVDEGWTSAVLRGSHVVRARHPDLDVPLDVRLASAGPGSPRPGASRPTRPASSTRVWACARSTASPSWRSGCCSPGSSLLS
jgi:hypothetical protein